MYGIIFESDLSYMNHIKEIGGNNIFFFKNKKGREVVWRRNDFSSISCYCYFIIVWGSEFPLMFKNFSSESLTILE